MASFSSLYTGRAKSRYEQWQSKAKEDLLTDAIAYYKDPHFDPTEHPNMECVLFNDSTKNIPVTSKKEYMRQHIYKTKKFLHRMRWKAYHFLNPNQQTEKANFGFKTNNNFPLVIEELKEFEDAMTKIIQKVKFNNIEYHFQKDHNEDI